MKDTRFAPVVGYLLGGMIVWAAAFAAAYGTAAVVCARGLAETTVLGMALLPFSVGAVTLAALIAAGLIAAVAYRRRHETAEEAGVTGFVHGTALLVALLAVVGIAWNAAPALFLASCA